MSPLANEVSELILIKRDLEYCVAVFRLFGLIAEDESHANNKLAATSLYRDGIISLMACFDESNQSSLKADAVYAGLENGMQYFRYLKDLRDTWIAHRFGPTRFATYGFLIDPKTGEIEGYGDFVVESILAEKSQAQQLTMFARHAFTFAEQLTNRKIEALKLEAISLYPSQRKKLPDAQFRTPSSSEFRVGRRKYQNDVDQKARRKPTQNEPR